MDTVVEIPVNDIVVSIPVGIPGPPGPTGDTGPEGPQGPAGSGASGGYYRHIQGAAATTWVIPHNLGFFPNVTAFDADPVEIGGEVVHDSVNMLHITFSVATTGNAYLS